MLELTGAVLQPVCGIYEIRNIQTGQCYIGQSKSILSRWASHFYQLGTGKHTLYALQRDWNAYGPDAFKVSVVKIVDDAANLLAEEAAIAREYINSGIKLYNSVIDGWLNEEELAARLARAREVAEQEERVLQRKRANQNEKRNQNRSDSRDAIPVRTERGIQGRGGLFGNSTGSPVESIEWGLRKPEAGLLVGKQGFDTEAGTERPAPQGMAENGRRGERDQDDREVFPIFNSDAAEILASHLPDDEKGRYLQDLIADTFDIVGSSAIDIALVILAAFSPEDVAEAWHMLDPSTASMVFETTDEEYAAIKSAAESYPGGRNEWLFDFLKGKPDGSDMQLLGIVHDFVVNDIQE